jgi:hypothetical protein
MSTTTTNPPSTSSVSTGSLKKFLQAKALASSDLETLKRYLGPNTQPEDHRAWVDYLQDEYVAHGKRTKFNTAEAMVYGVYSLLDSMSSSSARTESLEKLLEPSAYFDRQTYDHYLTTRHSKEQEKEFRRKLDYIKRAFGKPVDLYRALAVAQYMTHTEEEEEDEDEDDGDESTSTTSSSSGESTGAEEGEEVEEGDEVEEIGDEEEEPEEVEEEEEEEPVEEEEDVEEPVEEKREAKVRRARAPQISGPQLSPIQGHRKLGHNQPGHSKPGHRKPGHRKPGHSTSHHRPSRPR